MQWNATQKGFNNSYLPTLIYPLELPLRDYQCLVAGIIDTIHSLLTLLSMVHTALLFHWSPAFINPPWNAYYL